MDFVPKISVILVLKKYTFIYHIANLEIIRARALIISNLWQNSEPTKILDDYI